MKCSRKISFPILLATVLVLPTFLVGSTPVSSRVPAASTARTYTWRPFVMPADPVAGPSLATATPVASPQAGTTQPSTTPKPRQSNKVVRHGEASWGYGFHGHVVTRYPRGTVIRVCGRLGCTGKVKSWGYGPAKRTGRIADLDVHVFENVCGPRSMGVCQIRLEVWR